MNPSTIEKTEASKFSDEEPEPRDYTLAQAVEEMHMVRDQCLRVQSELEEDVDRFRAALRYELKERNRKLDLRDWMMIVGLAMLAFGIAVASHWSYSLIVMGISVAGLSVFPLLRRPTAK